VLVEEFSEAAWGPRQPDWLRLLRPEHANLQAALGYLTETAEGAADAVTMARKLDLYWSASGLLDEGRHWLEIALATGAGTPQERALAMGVAARYAVLQHDRDRATELVQAGTVVARTIQDSPALGLLQIPAAMLAVWAGTPTVAAEQADSAVSLLRHAPDPSDELLALFVAGVCHGFARNPVEASARHRRCITRADEVGERHMKALATTGLGEHELAAGRLDEATALFGEAIVVSRDLTDRLGLAVGLDSMGRVAVTEGRGERATLLLGAAESVWDAVGMSETGNPFAFAPTRSNGLQQARKLLGKQRFREMFRRGAQLGLEGAVTFALETDENPDLPPSAALEPSPLTRRELEVADLVADGLSNPEIAARLVISVRTAQGHVENILRKLGFNSRSLIAAWVTQRRLAADPAQDRRIASPAVAKPGVEQ
jgi:non-specific serine/threonine protein kinase